MAHEHLREAAETRSRETEKRVRRALDEMVREGAVVNFVAVATRANVSTDFLYRNARFRDQITALREHAGSGPTVHASQHVVAEDTTSSAVRALASQLREAKASHRTEVTELQKALAAAHGESLALRRRLQAYEG